MINELLEKFEDVFQPIPKEEIEGRWAEYIEKTAGVHRISFDLNLSKEFILEYLRKFPGTLRYIDDINIPQDITFGAFDKLSEDDLLPQGFFIVDKSMKSEKIKNDKRTT